MRILRQRKTLMEKENKIKEFWRAVKFAIISASAGIIQIGSFALMDLFIESYILKSYIALTLSVVWNFTINRKITFKSVNNVPIAMLKTLGYYAVFGPLSIHLADLYLVKTLGWNEILVQAITMLINFVTEFLFQRFVVYGKSCDTAVKKDTEKQEISQLNEEERNADKEVVSKD